MINSGNSYLEQSGSSSSNLQKNSSNEVVGKEEIKSEKEDFQVSPHFKTKPVMGKPSLIF